MRKVVFVETLGLGGSEIPEKSLLDVARSQWEIVAAVKASSDCGIHERYLVL